ncbi:MAG: AsmA family protein [Hyphomonadaceae bacterium]|nr:AsmA family protein [Hyphomonadaceae bacterium]
MGKIVLAIAAVVVAATLGVLGFAYWTLSRFDAGAEIERRVEAATGRDFAFTGPVSIAFWPAIGFRGEGAALANVAGGSAPHLLSARQVIVGVALRPLLQRRLEVTRFILVEPVLALEVDAQGRPNWILAPASAPPGSARPGPAAQGPSSLTDVHLAAASLRDGRVTYANAATGGTLAVDGIALKAAMSALDAPLSLSGAVTYRGAPIDVAATFGKARALLAGDVTPIALSLENEMLLARLDGELTVRSGALTGALQASGPSIRRLAAWSGAPFGEGFGLEAFAVAGRFSALPKQYLFENAGFSVDDIKARGDFIVGLARARPHFSGRLEIMDATFDPMSAIKADAPRRGVVLRAAERAAIDLNAYFAPPAQAAAVSPGPVAEVATLQPLDVAASGWNEAALNLGWIPAFDLDIEFTTGPLRVHNIQLEEAQVNAVMSAGYLAATVHRMAAYGGEGSGRLEVDARTPEIRVASEIAMRGVRSEAFLKDTLGFTKLSGPADFTWRLASRGATQKAMMATLSGNAAVSVANGALAGVNLGGVARTIRNALSDDLVSPTARTPFTSFAATFTAADGVIATQDLRLESRDARITGIGVIDAGGRGIDMRLTPRLGITALAVPFRVSGPWGRVGYASDILGRARPDVEAKVRAVVAKAKGPAAASPPR